MTDESPIARAVSLLDACGTARRQTLVGCSEEEIQTIESETGNRLPGAYRHFLQATGHSAGDFMVGTDVFFNELPSLRSGADDLVAEGECPPLPPTAFVFAGNQGYSFLFFDVLGGEDPQVLRWEEGETTFTQVADHFSDWLLSFVQEYI